MSAREMDAWSAFARWVRTAACGDRPAAGAAESEAEALRAALGLVLLRQLGAAGLGPAIGGDTSVEDLRHAAALMSDDLPGLFAAPAFSLEPALFAEIGNKLDEPILASALLDDCALGWLYQFWNDPVREAIDARIGARGKVGEGELAQKTQLFTERYMVEFLLQNSLGRAIRSVRLARGELMEEPPSPYLVSSPTLDETEAAAVPASVASLRVLDPACGTGHFLAGAFDLLLAAHRAESHAQADGRDDEAHIQHILGVSLAGIDIDARAVAVAAATLYLKAKKACRTASLPPLRLVATAFQVRGAGADERAAHELAWRGSLSRVSGTRLADLLPSSGPKGELGVRAIGEELTAGQRLAEILVEAHYDVVVCNPPYLASAKMSLPAESLREALGGQPDLFGAFVSRALELCAPHGVLAFVAPSNWMFLPTMHAVRTRILQGSLRLVADLGKGAFQKASKIIQTSLVVVCPQADPDGIPRALGARFGSRDAIAIDQPAVVARELMDASRWVPFDPALSAKLPGEPLLFWLSPGFLRRYAERPRIGDVADGGSGMATGDNDRFVRAVWEVPEAEARAAAALPRSPTARFLPYVKGAEGVGWIEPFRWLLRTDYGGLECRLKTPGQTIRCPEECGVSYTTIGHRFAARLHLVPSVRDIAGAAFYPRPPLGAAALLCALNRKEVRELAAGLNPTINFQQGDVRRLPFDAVDDADRIVATLLQEHALAERGREGSLDFVAPTAHAYEAARTWAQAAVDRSTGAALPPFEGEQVLPTAEAELSYALGRALGRYGAASDNGVLFVADAGPDDLSSSRAASLQEVWARHGSALAPGRDLGAFLRLAAFDLHKKIYENRPLYFPLSSARRHFVVLVYVHRWTRDTLADCIMHTLEPALQMLGAKPKDRLLSARKAELAAFIDTIRSVAERGPSTPGGAVPEREHDAAFVYEPDDGVRVNAAALWELLSPQWKEPEKLWQEIAEARGKREASWSRTAARYFPQRVRIACERDPSLAAAHGLLRELHPKPFATWEKRLRRELGEEFTLERAPASQS